MSIKDLYFALRYTQLSKSHNLDGIIAKSMKIFKERKFAIDNFYKHIPYVNLIKAISLENKLRFSEFDILTKNVDNDV